MSRSRSISQNIATSIDYVETRSNGWRNSGYDSSKGGMVGSVKTTVDNVTPGFRYRRDSGEIILNNFSRHSTERSYSPMSLHYSVPKDTGYECTWSGDCARLLELAAPADISLSYDLSRMSDVALVNAYAKIKGDVVCSGEVLHDIGQTVMMLKRPFGHARDLLERSFRRKRVKYGREIRDAARVQKEIWLETRYGLMPTVLDANTIVKNAMRLYRGLDRRRLVARAGQNGARSFGQSFNQLTLASPYNIWKATGSVSVNHTVSANAGVIYEVATQSLIDQIWADFQLGEDAILPTLWEITPLSFVVDWFVGVGTWLDAMNLPPNVRVLGNWVTTVDQHHAEYSGMIDHYGYRDGTPPVRGSAGSSTVHQCGVIRSVNRPLPPLPVKVTNWSTVTHALDAAALSLNPLLRLFDKIVRR